jgi:hypothetical protein
MSALQELQDWYHAQCDEDWEHGGGVRIESLDNPGWLVKIDLSDTALEGVPFEPLLDLEPDLEWVRCEVQERQFVGAGGPRQLERVLRAFLDWARSHEAA